MYLTLGWLHRQNRPRRQFLKPNTWFRNTWRILTISLPEMSRRGASVLSSADSFLAFVEIWGSLNVRLTCIIPLVSVKQCSCIELIRIHVLLATLYVMYTIMPLVLHTLIMHNPPNCMGNWVDGVGQRKFIILYMYMCRLITLKPEYAFLEVCTRSFKTLSSKLLFSRPKPKQTLIIVVVGKPL